jgi:hypothetical protein
MLILLLFVPGVLILHNIVKFLLDVLIPFKKVLLSLLHSKYGRTLIVIMKWAYLHHGG